MCHAMHVEVRQQIMWEISSLSSMWGPRDPAHVPRLSSKWLHPLSTPLAQAWGFNVASGLVL